MTANQTDGKLATTASAADWLKYRAAECASRTNAITDAICAVLSDVKMDGETEEGLDELLRELDDLAAENRAAAARFGDPNKYSDGRVVESFTPITPGMSQGVTWHPDPAAHRPTHWIGDLLSDPGMPSPGRYEVTLDAISQRIDVRVIRNADARIASLRERLERHSQGPEGMDSRE
ncbi:hypothetical protein [Mycobacterium paragordonae]|uniref:Uncharacterized protein n=1 Tax=Mycobacterium paragordonae TaxID=1389713 RepID=A0AAJ1S1T9_9MYCO|nr:hypothetical protein [Mycobacterium paragordonae]MDP7735137.1 hypothetical protein [Mycobacterium paragordonae]